MTAGMATLDHSERRARLALLFEETGIQVAICWQQPTVCYLTGNDISGPNALAWTSDGGWLVICDEYDEYNFVATAQEITRKPYLYTASLWAAIAEWLRTVGRRARLIGVEQAEIRHTAWATISDAIGDAQLVSLDELVATARLRKSAAEVERIRAAARCVQAAYLAAQEALRAPTSEPEVAALLYESLIREGSEYVASQPYVKSGPRAFLTHARWANRRIEPGDHVLLEVGASVDRYHASLMRTRLAAVQSTEYRQGVAAVVAGRDAYLDVIKPGITAEELHEAHLLVLDRFGIRAWNRHAGGYSLGIAFPPYWGEVPLLTLTTGVARKLEPPMAFHLISGVLDPGARVPHIGLSECVLLTEDGIERLVEVSDFL
jgi:Xaa-Pro aminopeptidase